MNFFVRLKDFCAINFPAVYESLYRFRHGIRVEDLGEAVGIHSEIFTEHVRLRNKQDFALKVPLNFSAPSVKLRVAAVVHIFYPELADELKNLLLNIPCAVDVFISTTATEKKFAIESVFADFNKGNVTIKIFDNRGRDIAASFVGFKEIYQNYDVCLHIHSKKSLHAKSRLSGWRDHLYKNLLGSPEIVGGILEILSDKKVGLVFPQYFAPIRMSVNWGNNYLNTKNFLRGLGVEMDNHHLIEFPAGSMFWFKPKALAPLLDSNLTFDDFPPEQGQIDGTIAHAIERAFLFIVEAAGFSWVKVDSGEKFFGMTPILKSSSQAELTANIERARHSVLKRY